MSQFSRADYLWLAKRLRVDLTEANKCLSSGDARAQAVSSIYRWTNALAEDNPRNFNRDLFLANCGLTDSNQKRIDKCRP